MTYTALALVGVLAAAVLDVAVLRTRLLRRRLFWVSYAIVLLFQLIVNGVLTGRRIVRYDPAAILPLSFGWGNPPGDDRARLLGGWRVAYAPVEDLLFGFALVLATLASWVWWGRRGLDR